MLRWLVLDKLDWLYLHISSGRNGAFLFGFTTMAELILLFVWGSTWSWWAECSAVSKSEDFIKKSESEPSKGITDVEDKPSRGVGKERSSDTGKDVRLFGLVSVRVTWLGGLGAVYAVCKFGWLRLGIMCSCQRYCSCVS